MDSILLTGASGYLGSRVARALNQAGLAFKTLNQRLESVAPVSLDCAVVLHCAGALRRRAEQLHSVNVEGTRRLLQGLNGDARVIYVSSRSVYPATGHHVVDETQPPAPWDAYGISKLAAEALIRESGRPYVIFRAGALFGHPDRSGTFPDFALDHALANRPVRLATPDRDEDYLDVDAFAQTLVAACADGPHWGRTLNVAGPARPLSAMVGAMRDQVESRAGEHIQVVHVDMPVPQYPLLATDRCAELFPDIGQPLDAQIFARMLDGRLRQDGPGARGSGLAAQELP